MPTLRSAAITPVQTPLFLLDPQSALSENPQPILGNTSMATAGSLSGAPNENPAHILGSPPNIYSSPPSHHHRSSTRERVTQADLLAAMREQQAFMTHQLFQEERLSSRNALREQHEFMADQQRQLMSLLVSRPPFSDQPPSGPAHNTAPKVRMADPPTFSGSLKETDNFLSSLENIFDSQPNSFPTDESRIRYALTFLSGGASNWRKLLLREVSDGSFSLNSWFSFEKRFRESFGNPHLVEEARRKLWTIRQGQRTSEEFFLEFEELRLESDICENSLIMFLQAALRPSLLEEVMRRDPQPVSYLEWKNTVLKADQNQRNSAATKSFNSNSSTHPARRTNNTFIPFPFRNSSSIRSNPTTTTPSAPSTQTNSNQRPDSKTGTNKNCWKCNDPSHLSRNCPKNATSNPKLRALFEHVDEIDAAYHAASSGAKSIRSMLDSETDIEDTECRTLLERLVSEHPVFVKHDE